MIEIFKYEKRYKYPHMSRLDTEIWNRFLNKYPLAYDTCQYDFHVGDTAPFNTLMDDGEDQNQDKLYRFRIDVVGKKGDNIDIIEIKPNARLTALGEVENYKILYERDEEISSKVNMVIITDKEMPNMDYLCKAKGIKLIVV